MARQIRKSYNLRCPNLMKKMIRRTDPVILNGEKIGTKRLVKTR